MEKVVLVSDSCRPHEALGFSEKRNYELIKLILEIFKIFALIVLFAFMTPFVVIGFIVELVTSGFWAGNELASVMFDKISREVESNEAEECTK